MEISATVPAASITLNSGMQNSLQGMKKARKAASQASVEIARGNITAQHVVNLQIAEYSFKANAIVLKTHDQMVGTLLNTFA